MGKDTGTILVLGHSGFIGKHITDCLWAQGYDVLGASSSECNLLDPLKTRSFLATVPDNLQIVFASSKLRSAQNSFQTLIENITMVHNFLVSIEKSKVSSLLFLSSTSLYGRSPVLPINERSISAPANFYDISKIANESLLNMPGRLECPITLLRLPGIYGVGDGGSSLIGRFFSQLKDTGSVNIYGDGTTRRDLVEVHDVGRIVQGIIDKPFHGIFNVGTGHSKSLNEIVQIIARIANLPLVIEYGPQDLETPSHLVFDTKALSEWLPELEYTNLEKGCTDYISELLN